MAKVKVEPTQLKEREILTSELASIVGKTPQWIRQLTRDGVLKQTERGKYSLSKAIQAYIEHASGGKEEDNKPRLIDHKTEHEHIKVEIASIELSKMRNNLHNAEDVKAVMNDMLTTYRQKILAISARLSPQLVGIQEAGRVKSILTKELHETLTELSNYDPEMFYDTNEPLEESR